MSISRKYKKKFIPLEPPSAATDRGGITTNGSLPIAVSSSSELGTGNSKNKRTTKKQELLAVPKLSSGRFDRNKPKVKPTSGPPPSTLAVDKRKETTIPRNKPKLSKTNRALEKIPTSKDLAKKQMRGPYISSAEAVKKATLSLMSKMNKPNELKEKFDVIVKYTVKYSDPRKAERNKIIAIENGVGKAISTAIQIHINDKEVVKAAIRALGISATPFRVVNYFLKEDCHKFLFLVMKVFCADLKIVHLCFIAFTNLSVCPLFLRYCYRDNAFNDDEIPAIIRNALTTHENDMLLLCFGFEAVAALLHGADNNVKKKLIFSYDLVTIVARALLNFSGASNPKIQDTEVQLQRRGLNALQLCKEHFYFLILIGVDQICINAFRNYKKYPKVILKVGTFVLKLLKSKEVAKAFYEQNLLGVLRECAEYYMEKLSSVKRADELKSLHKVSNYIEALIYVTQIIPTVIQNQDILSQYTSSTVFSSDVDFFGKLLRCSYLRGIQTNSEEIYSVKLELQKSLLSLNDRSEKMGEWAAYLLWVLTKHDSVTNLMVRKYFWEAVVQLADAFKNNLDIQVKAVKSLSRMAEQTFPPPPPGPDENVEDEINLNPKRYENSFYGYSDLINTLYNAQHHFDESKKVSRDVKKKLELLLESAEKWAM